MSSNQSGRKQTIKIENANNKKSIDMGLLWTEKNLIFGSVRAKKKLKNIVFNDAWYLMALSWKVNPGSARRTCVAHCFVGCVFSFLFALFVYTNCRVTVVKCIYFPVHKQVSLIFMHFCTEKLLNETNQPYSYARRFENWFAFHFREIGIKQRCKKE